jgi:hypothetical protein
MLWLGKSSVRGRRRHSARILLVIFEAVDQYQDSTFAFSLCISNLLARMQYRTWFVFRKTV